MDYMVAINLKLREAAEKEAAEKEAAKELFQQTYGELHKVEAELHKAEKRADDAMAELERHTRIG